MCRREHAAGARCWGGEGHGGSADRVAVLVHYVATSGSPNAPLVSASCREPLVAAIAAGRPQCRQIKSNRANHSGSARRHIVGSDRSIAVNTDDIATPLELVISVSVFNEVVANVPLAPVAGAVKVTNAPLTGVLPMVTVAVNCVVNAV